MVTNSVLPIRFSGTLNSIIYTIEATYQDQFKP